MSEEAFAIPAWYDLPHHVRDEWDNKVDQLVPAPPLLTELTGVDLTLERFDTRELAETLSHDALLAGRILAVANSAKFGLAQQMTSIQRAMVHLGFNLVKSIVVSFLIDYRVGESLNISLGHVDYMRKWSAGASVIAFRWARAVELTDASLASTVGLLARVGTILLGLADPPVDEEYQQMDSEADRLQFEMASWEIASPLLSGELVRRWGLPDPMPELLERSWEPVARALPPDPNDPYLRLLVLVAASLALADHYLREPKLSADELLTREGYKFLQYNVFQHELAEQLGAVWNNARTQRELAAVTE
jgi:HD-like signal output (HDOD) protein